jgi:hypothetical protein
MLTLTTRSGKLLAVGLALLVATPAAAAVGVLPGADGITNSLTPPGQSQQPSCPDGTTLLVKFDYDEGEDRFVVEEGGHMGVNVTITERKDGEPDPLAVEWNSTTPIDAVVVKNGTENGTFYFDGATGGTVDVGDDGSETKAISNLQFCVGDDETTTTEQTTTDTTTEQTTTDTTTEPVTIEQDRYYQVDLVVGEPLDQVGPEGEGEFYGDQQRLVYAVHGSSETPITLVGDGGPRSITDDLAACVQYESASVENGQMTVTFTVAEGCEQTISLAAHEKPGPGFDREMTQPLYDSATETFGPGTHTLTVDLPGRTPTAANVDAGSPGESSVTQSLGLLASLFVGGTVLVRRQD